MDYLPAIPANLDDTTRLTRQFKLWSHNTHL